MQVGALTTIADFFVICSADSPRQANAVSEGIDAALSREGIQPFHIEGAEHANWVLMDYSDVIIHIFKPDIRAFYALERLWGDAPKVALPKVAPPKITAPKIVPKAGVPHRRA